MPTDLVRKAEALRAVAGAFRDWFPIAWADPEHDNGSPAGRDAARKALALACENLPLIEDCRCSYGLHGWFEGLIANLTHCRAVLGRQDLGDFWTEGRRMTSHHPRGPSLWDELERWAKEIEKAAALHIEGDLNAVKTDRAMGEGGAGGDRRDYQPATEAQASLHFSYKVFTKWLEAHPEIRRYKPRKNRLMVHAGDVVKAKAHKEKRDFEAADSPSSAEVADDYARRIEERKAKEKQRRARRVM